MSADPSPRAERQDYRRAARARALPLWGSAATLGGAGVALLLLVAVGWQPLLDLDVRVARALHRSALTHPGWTGTARVFTDWVWDTWTMRAVVTAVAGWFWSRGARPLALVLVASLLIGAAVQQSLKAILDRGRPQWEESVGSAHFAAMPSGHAMTAALACGLLVWLAWAHLNRPLPRWMVTGLAAVSVAGVSLTRVYLGVHWLTDVVVGSLLGVALAALVAGSWHAGLPREGPGYLERAG